MVLIGRARIAVLAGDGDAVVEHARSAIDNLGTSQPAEQGAAVWALAQGFTLQRDAESASDAFRRAVDLLSVHGQRYHAGLAAVEWAELLKGEGREEEAESILRRAYDLGVEAEVKATDSR
jgi:ATP/maltotriose-dependent transcriptional regulator MalT